MTFSTPCRDEWLPVHLAAPALGISISTLNRWRYQGLLRAGVDWRRKFPSGNSPVLYNIDACTGTMAAACATDPATLEAAI